MLFVVGWARETESVVSLVASDVLDGTVRKLAALAASHEEWLTRLASGSCCRRLVTLPLKHLL